MVNRIFKHFKHFHPIKLQWFHICIEAFHFQIVLLFMVYHLNHNLSVSMISIDGSNIVNHDIPLYYLNANQTKYSFIAAKFDPPPICAIIGISILMKLIALFGYQSVSRETKQSSKDNTIPCCIIVICNMDFILSFI